MRSPELEHGLDSLARTDGSATRSIPKRLAALIFWKELRDIFRDRRTRFGAIVSPLVIVPLILWAGGFLMHQQQASAATKVYKIGIEGAANLPGMVRYLQGAPNIKLETTSAADAQAAVAKHKLNCVIVIPPTAGKAVSTNGTAQIVLLLDSANDVSAAATMRVEAAIDAYSKQVGFMRLQKAHLSRSFGTPLAVTEQSVKGGGSPLMLVLSILLPYILTLNALTGGMYAANDQIAGEKERGTLETLLVSPASRRDIVVGKFCAVACVCLLSGILSVTGLSLPFILHAPGMNMFGAGSGDLGALHFSGEAVACIVLAQVPLALLCAGVLIAVSTIARNQKEVQVYQTPLVLAVVLPAMASLSISSDVSWRYALIPVLNSALVIKQSLAGIFEPVFLGVALASAFLYAGIAVAISVKLFENEKVLLKT